MAGSSTGVPPVATRIFFANAAAVALQFDGVRIDDFRACLDDLDARFRQIVRVDLRQARDFLFLRGHERRPVKDGLFRKAPAETGGILKIVGETARVNIELFRHAAADHAGAAHAVFLGDHHRGTVRRSNPRGAHAARTTTNDEEIDIIRHLKKPFGVRSEIVTLFLHFRADAVHHFNRKLAVPGVK
jgi:hypothetical protein